MKADYKNWVPQGMLWGIYVGTGIIFVLLVLSLWWLDGTMRLLIGGVLGLLFIGALFGTREMTRLYLAFSYNGNLRLAEKIVEKVADFVTIPPGGCGLDVGCGSGALTIACAKRNPKARMVGLDRWGKEYASFTQDLCEANAQAEGVQERTEFMPGDARKLPFDDESFDVVTSNFVYHNINGFDRQQLLKETLRVLKKGGTFALHDLMSPSSYGDLGRLVEELGVMGYEKVELIDTMQGMILETKEAKKLYLSSAKLLVGKK